MKPEQDCVRMLLTETVILLCKNGLIYARELKVQGTLGITLDNNDVFVVHINECLVEKSLSDDVENKTNYDSKSGTYNGSVIGEQYNVNQSKYPARSNEEKQASTKLFDGYSQVISNSDHLTSIVHRSGKPLPIETLYEPSVALIQEDSVQQHCLELAQQNCPNLNFVKAELIENNSKNINSNLINDCQNEELDLDNSNMRLNDSYTFGALRLSRVVRKGVHVPRNNNQRPKYNMSEYSFPQPCSLLTSRAQALDGNASSQTSCDSVMIYDKGNLQDTDQTSHIPTLAGGAGDHALDLNGGTCRREMDVNDDVSYVMSSEDYSTMSAGHLLENEVARVCRSRRTRRSTPHIKAYTCTLDGCYRTFYRGSEMYRHQREKHGSGWVRFARSHTSAMKQSGRNLLMANAQDIQ